MKMKNNIYIKNRIKYLFMLFLAVSMYYGCGKDPAPVLYDEYKNNGTPDPVVTSITPKDYAFAGLDTVTISGSNFSDSAHTLVYFDNVEAPLISVSPTQIKVKAPNTPGDAISIRVVVTTASAYAPPVSYGLREIQKTFFGGLTFPDAASSITFDKTGNLYFSMTVNGSYNGVMKIDANKAMTEYSPRKAGDKPWTALKFVYGPYGAAGQLIGAKNNLGLWQINLGQLPTAAPWVLTDKKVNDFDVDPDANIWAAGEGGIVYKIKSDKSLTKYTVGTASKINAVRVFKASDNTLYLYIGGTKDGKEGVWRYRIVNQEITPSSEELYFDFAANYPGKYILGLTFSNDGEMYIGTDDASAIVTVDASKNFKPFLPGVILPKFLSFVWDSYDKTNGLDLVYSRAAVAGEDAKNFNPKLLSAMTFKQGAPYYGLEL